MSETATPTTGIRAWEPQKRRTFSLYALGAGVAALVIAIAVYFLVGDVAILDWVLVALLALVLAFIIVMMVMGGAKATTRTPEGTAHDAHAGPSGPAMVGEPAPPAPAAESEAKAITLRCGDCGTVFDITDTGQRPLYHTCPGCGAEGVLKAETAPPLDAQPGPAAPEPAPTMEPPAPTPEPAAATPRRLKLRCGGCKEVFVIEDSGERPLRRPCPHCGRMGEIR